MPLSQRGPLCKLTPRTKSSGLMQELGVCRDNEAEGGGTERKQITEIWLRRRGAEMGAR